MSKVSAPFRWYDKLLDERPVVWFVGSYVVWVSVLILTDRLTGDDDSTFAFLWVALILVVALLARRWRNARRGGGRPREIFSKDPDDYR